MKILGIVPARGGSKGVPRKNVKLLGGKPLIQYTIDEALKCESLSKVMVSTDDQEIATIAQNLGAEVPELRPTHLASDSSPTIDTILYTLKYYNKVGEYYDAVCLLQPTTPMRTSVDIANAISTFAVAESESLISVLPVPHEYNPHWVFELEKNHKTLRISTGEKEIIPRRQELPPAYYRNGAIYLTKSDVILKQKSLYGKSISYYLMSPEVHVNIDTIRDWEKAEALAKAHTSS